MNIKKGDNVIVITGKDKGKQGKVIKSLKNDNKIVVEGLNIKKKHQKPTRSDQKGQILEIASPIHISNVMIIDPKTGKGTRVGKGEVKGKKIRIAKGSGVEIK